MDGCPRRMLINLTWIYILRAVEKLHTFKPDEHQESGERVAPLVQFFELVHIGDTIQSMVQVYFDRELVRMVYLKIACASDWCIATTYR